MSLLQRNAASVLPHARTFLTFLTALEGSVRLEMLIGNGLTQIIRFYDVDGFGRPLTFFVVCHLSHHLFSLLHGGVAGSEGLWVINGAGICRLIPKPRACLATGGGSVTTYGICKVGPRVSWASVTARSAVAVQLVWLLVMNWSLVVLGESLIVALKAVSYRWGANTASADFKHREATPSVLHWCFSPTGESVLRVWSVCSMMSTMLRDSKHTHTHTTKKQSSSGFSSADSAVPVKFHFLLAGKMRAGEEERVWGVMHADKLALFIFLLLLRRSHVVLHQIGVEMSQCDLKWGTKNQLQLVS